MNNKRKHMISIFHINDSQNGYITIVSLWNTIECRYNSIDYNVALYAATAGTEFNHSLKSQKTTLNSSYGVSFVMIWDKIDRIKACPLCNSFLIYKTSAYLYFYRRYDTGNPYKSLKPTFSLFHGCRQADMLSTLVDLHYRPFGMLQKYRIYLNVRG